jgi:hypothetical protein
MLWWHKNEHINKSTRVGCSMCFYMFCLNSMIARYIYIHIYLNKTKTSECKELPPIMYSSKRMYKKAKVEVNDADCSI